MNKKIEINIEKAPDEIPEEVPEFDEEDFALEVEMYPDVLDEPAEKNYLAGRDPFLVVEPLNYDTDGINGFKITSSLLSDDPEYIGKFFHELSQYEWSNDEGEGENEENSDETDLDEDTVLSEMFEEEVNKVSERLSVDEITEDTGIELDDHTLYHLAQLLVSKGIFAVDVIDDEEIEDD